MKVLWLVSWYPDKLSPYNGDFIKRHAAAVSLFDEVQVIYVTKDEQGVLTKSTHKEEQGNGRLSETIIYYYPGTTSLPFFNKLLSAKRYRQLYKQAIDEYVRKNGKPDLVHVHVGMKAGALAGWIQKKWGIDYVVSEHWTGFLDEARERFNDLPVYYKNGWRKVMGKAKGWSTVSNYLKESLETKFPGIQATVIPNVVDTGIFTPTERTTGDLKFIHISHLDDFKNPHDILRSFAILRRTYPGATLEMIGSRRAEIVQLANELQLQDHVSFMDEVPQPVLADHIKRSTALVLYSRYETFGCVVIEANACGIPVVVSDIPVFHETVKEGENGYFAAGNNPEVLAEKMIILVKTRSSFSSHAIATTTASKYSYPVIGKRFSDWYKEVLQRS